VQVSYSIIVSTCSSGLLSYEVLHMRVSLLSLQAPASKWIRGQQQPRHHIQALWQVGERPPHQMFFKSLTVVSTYGRIDNVMYATLECYLRDAGGLAASFSMLQILRARTCDMDA
jgi:hypothetical protein